MSKSVLLSYIIIADVTRIKREVKKKKKKKTHKNTNLSGANSQATELSSATGTQQRHLRRFLTVSAEMIWLYKPIVAAAAAVWVAVWVAGLR